MNGVVEWDKEKWDKKNKAIIAEFRANEGQVDHPVPVLLLHTTGAKSGQVRMVPLTYIKDGDQIAVIAAKTGTPTHPDWYHNIIANPQTTVEVGTEKYEAEATVATGRERTNLWEQVVSVYPFFAEYQRKTTRIIPVIVLTQNRP